MSDKIFFTPIIQRLATKKFQDEEWNQNFRHKAFVCELDDRQTDECIRLIKRIAQETTFDTNRARWIGEEFLIDFDDEMRGKFERECLDVLAQGYWPIWFKVAREEMTRRKHEILRQRLYQSEATEGGTQNRKDNRRHIKLARKNSRLLRDG